MTDPRNTAVYVILVVYLWAICMASAFSYFMNTSNRKISCGPFSIVGDRVSDFTKNFLGAGSGLGTFVFFFTMCASLFSAFSVSGVANEAHTRGFQAIRWICAGVPIYGCYLILAPRCHALGKSRGYLSPNEFLFDRFAAPSCSPLVAHGIRLVSLGALQLPIFTYLITQFTAIGTEIESYTNGEITRYGALFTAAIILLILEFLGGFRGVAYTDVIQGIALIIGSIVFFCVQHVNLGGMGAMSEYTRSESFRKALANVTGGKDIYANYNNVMPESGGWSVAAFASFVIKITIAATMFPHLIQRLFVAKSSLTIRRGLSFMNLSSMMLGWIAIQLFQPRILRQGVYGAVASQVRSTGTTGEFASALLISAAVCAMMSTADSALIAFSTMWLKDFYLPYVKPCCSHMHQLIFAKCVSTLGLGIGVLAASMSLANPNVWDLSMLFSLQAVTPIHAAPAMWLGLHWKGLRGEPVLAGMIVGLAITIGMTASPVTNIKLVLKQGAEEHANGWSLAIIGLCFNLLVTVIGGLLLEAFPNLLPSNPNMPRFSRPLDLEKTFGPGREKGLNPIYWTVFVILFAFMTPFYRVNDFGKPDSFVEFMPTWAFTSLLFTAALTLLIAYGYSFLWQDYDVPEVPSVYPLHPVDLARMLGTAGQEEGKDKELETRNDTEPSVVMHTQAIPAAYFNNRPLVPAPPFGLVLAQPSYGSPHMVPPVMPTADVRYSAAHYPGSYVSGFS